MAGRTSDGFGPTSDWSCKWFVVHLMVLVIRVAGRISDGFGPTSGWSCKWFVVHLMVLVIRVAGCTSDGSSTKLPFVQVAGCTSGGFVPTHGLSYICRF